MNVMSNIMLHIEKQETIDICKRIQPNQNQNQKMTTKHENYPYRKYDVQSLKQKQGQYKNDENKQDRKSRAS